jgi:hypothetical protein
MKILVISYTAVMRMMCRAWARAGYEIAVTSPYYRDLNLPHWLEALRRPHLRHFIWDQTLGREYSKWFGLPFRRRPTAIDPQGLNPEMAQHSSRKFEPVDVCFLGDIYSLSAADAVPDAEEWATRSVQEPDRTIFELARYLICLKVVPKKSRSMSASN